MPVVAPAGTVAVIWVAELTVKPAAFVPLNWTAVAPVKFVPVMVTTAAADRAAGRGEAGDGRRAGPAVKVPALVAVPPGVVTLTVPVVAPAGTVAVIWVAEFTV